MPYIVEKDYVLGSYLTQDAASGDTTIYVADTSNFSAGAATIYDDSVAVDSVTGLRGNTESITINSTTSTTLVLNAGLTNSYTGQFSGNLYQSNLGVSERVEFDIPILSRWCKIAQIKIVQQTTGVMAIAFEVWEETPIYEGNRIEMHKNVIRRNISLSATQGGWYGESLVNNLILYKDGEEPGDDDQSDFQWNLHCAIFNEAVGTASEFHVLFKLADIGEAV